MADGAEAEAMQQQRAKAQTRLQVALALWSRIDWGKVLLFLISLFLFILAITLMKEASGELAPLVRDRFRVNNMANALGFGWLFAYVIMSGSPVAAVALTFFDAQVIDQLGAFAMITGSRLGASFIVIFIGFIYVLRGRDRAASLGMGLLSLLVTATTVLAAFGVGILFLNNGLLDGFELQAGGILNSITDRIFDPIAGFFLAFLPRWALFLVGLGIIILSFNLFDKCLPQMALKESQMGRMSRVVYRPLVMFLLGASITMISMSVSVSLSILVPLSQRGFVRRENVIPYIMGANITTFIDTMLAAVLLNNADAFTIVAAGMVGMTVVSLAVLLFFFRIYQQAMLGMADWVTARKRHLALFMISILVIPVLLLLW